MGKRGKPKRIMRCGKPKRCPECKKENLLKVVYGMPSNKVWDNVEKYDIRGCCLPPFQEVKDKSGNIYHCPEPTWSCANKNCRLEIYWRKECELIPPIDDSYHFYGMEWKQKDFVIQSQQLARLRNKVHKELGALEADKCFQKALKTVTTVQELHELEREYLGKKNNLPSD